MWKSDTLRAYTCQPRYQQQLLSQCHDLANAIVEFIASFNFVKAVNWGHKLTRLQEQIIEPAARLSRNMSCGIEQYRWEWYEDKWTSSDGLVRKRDIREFTIMDALTHNKVPRRKFAEHADDAKIGVLLLVIYPALFRCGTGEQNDIIIEKALILIRLETNQNQG